MGTVKAICVSGERGVQKHPVEKASFAPEWGIVCDAHGGNWHRQVSLLGEESVDKVRPLLPDLAPGAFAENLLTRGLCLYELPIGTRLRAGEVLLEVTQIGKECHQGCAIRQLTGDCVMPREGIFAIVLEEGVIRPGDSLEVEL